MARMNNGATSEFLFAEKEISGFRRILPQVKTEFIYFEMNKMFNHIWKVIATTVKNLHAFEFGLLILTPTILIPPLTGIPNEFNRNETLSISSAEASWIGMQTFSHKFHSNIFGIQSIRLFIIFWLISNYVMRIVGQLVSNLYPKLSEVYYRDR